MVDILIDAARKLILTERGPCIRPEDFVSADVAQFTPDDLHRVLDAYYNYDINTHMGADEAEVKQRRAVLADIYLHSQPGRLCVAGFGPAENRRFADRIQKSCGGVLRGREVAEKCEALYKTFDSRADKPRVFSVQGLKYYSTEYTLASAALLVGGTITGAGFHLGGRGVDRIGRALSVFHAKRPAVAPATAASESVPVASGAAQAARAGFFTRFGRVFGLVGRGLRAGGTALGVAGIVSMGIEVSIILRGIEAERKKNKRYRSPYEKPDYVL